MDLNQKKNIFNDMQKLLDLIYINSVVFFLKM